MLDERLQALLRVVEQLSPQDQLFLADQLEEWLEGVEWRRVANEPGPDALDEAAIEEVRQGATKPPRPDDFSNES
jgi:hypothetical protein